MKPNKLTPGFNLMWESSRMMLPEHKEAIQRKQLGQKKRPKPELDEQELVLLSDSVCLAYMKKQTVQLELHHPFRREVLSGQISKISPMEQRLKITSENGSRWILFSDILSLEACE